MINSIDETIETFFRDFLPEDQFELSFNPPNKEWVSRLSGDKPVVNIYLYDIRENTQLRSNQWEVYKKEDGSYTKEPPLIRLNLYYLITVWSPDTSDGVIEEHYVMGLIFSNLFRYSKIPPEFFQGEIRRIKPQPEIPISAASEDAFKEQGIGQFWSTMELSWKPALYLTVTAPIALPSHIKGKLVTTKISKFGHEVTGSVLTVKPPVRSSLFQTENTNIYRMGISGKSSKLLRWRKKGYRTLIVDNIDNFEVGDWIAVIDGEKTETGKIIYKNPSSNKLVLRDKLVHTHKKNTEIRKLTKKAELSLDLIDNLHGGKTTVYIDGTDSQKIDKGSYILFKDPEKEEAFMITEISRDRVIYQPEKYTQFGGIVTNNSENTSPLIGARVKLIDGSNNLINETITDIHGRFSFRKIRELPKKLRVSKEGYKDKEVTLSEFPKNRIEDMIIRLEPVE